jgi:hypothetical protein
VIELGGSWSTQCQLGRLEAIANFYVFVHGSIPRAALFAVSLDKLPMPQRISPYVHQLVPIVADVTDEEISFLVDLGLDLSEGEPLIAISTGPHSHLRLYLAGIIV